MTYQITAVVHGVEVSIEMTMGGPDSYNLMFEAQVVISEEYDVTVHEVFITGITEL